MYQTVSKWHEIQSARWITELNFQQNQVCVILTMFEKVMASVTI